MTRGAPLLMLAVRTTASAPDVRPSHLHRSSVRSCQVASGARVAAEDHRAGRGRKIFRCCSGAVDGSPTGSDTADSREDSAPSRNSIRDSTRCNGVCSRPPAPSYRLLIERAFSHCNRRRGPVRDWNEFTQPSDPSDWAWADGGRGKLKVGRMIGWLVSAAAAALQKQVPITTVNLT